MMEGVVMEYVKWFVALVGIAFIAVSAVFMFKINELNSFQQDVNYQIERHGGLTEDAMVALNDRAKAQYGGCLAAGPEPGVGCLDVPGNDLSDPEAPRSGFFVAEIKQNGSAQEWSYRGNDEQARYGTSINYGVTREIGQWGSNDSPLIRPAVVGMASSRVRGVAGE